MKIAIIVNRTRVPYVLSKRFIEDQQIGKMFSITDVDLYREINDQVCSVCDFHLTDCGWYYTLIGKRQYFGFGKEVYVVVMKVDVVII